MEEWKNGRGDCLNQDYQERQERQDKRLDYQAFILGPFVGTGFPRPYVNFQSGRGIHPLRIGQRDTARLGNLNIRCLD